MTTYQISKKLSPYTALSDKAKEVMRMFGLSADRLADNSVTIKCKVEIKPGDIVYITGPSGSGKSVLLKELERSIPHCEKVNLEQIELSADKCVIDCIEGDFVTGLRLLSTVGLNDVFCVLNSPANLSDGQKYRFRLAVALAAKKKFIFADEFCCGLDRITAACVAYNIHRYAKHKGIIFILASSHEDILLDLAPDVIITRELSGSTEVVYK